MGVVKNIMANILDPFTHLCNISLVTGVFPDGMKCAKVVPLFKGGDKKQFTNYRPISLLPQFSKILEKVYCKRLVNFIEINNVLHENQYGFRSSRCTSHAIAALVEDITDSFECHKTTVGVFIDF